MNPYTIYKPICAQVCQGDEIIVDVENSLQSEETTLHWHGHHQRGTPYMDGVPFVTQCPIPSGNSFRYHFRAAHAGTHFWHSHTGKYTPFNKYIIIRKIDLNRFKSNSK